MSHILSNFLKEKHLIDRLTVRNRAQKLKANLDQLIDDVELENKTLKNEVLRLNQLRQVDLAEKDQLKAQVTDLQGRLEQTEARLQRIAKIAKGRIITQEVQGAVFSYPISVRDTFYGLFLTSSMCYLASLSRPPPPLECHVLFT